MISWARVNELMDEIGQEAFEEVATLFLEEFEAKLAMLTGRESAADMADAMHFLKGSATNLGFADVAAQVSLNETSARVGLPVDLPALRTLYTQSKGCFLTGLARGAAA
ncbi:MAG: Hpt domain-containing protein [Roseivivax sp.]|nr:Hpt domain-containing protein [Roseivivax sp.]